MKIHLSHPGHYCAGLGDVVLWSWLADGPEPLTFYAEGRNREMLELLGCRISGDPTDARDPHEAYNAELRERCRRPRVEIWAEHMGFPCVPKRPNIQIGERAFMRRRVALCPQTHFRTREWPRAYWVDLNWKLRDANCDPIWILESEDKELIDAGGPSMAYWGHSLRSVAELLASSAIVVANDSGLAHLAGAIGRPTLAMMGPTSANVFAHTTDVLPFATADALECAGCHYAAPFRAACQIGCQALYRVYPQEVAETVLFCLERLARQYGTRRLLDGISAETTVALCD